MCVREREKEIPRLSEREVRETNKRAGWGEGGEVFFELLHHYPHTQNRKFEKFITNTKSTYLLEYIIILVG